MKTPQPLSEDGAYALGEEAERRRRYLLLSQPHMKPLTLYVEHVQQELGTGRDMPSFDPCDGGIDAEALFLLETPGRKAHGTAFISRDNPDPTARNLRDLMLEADIPRRKAVIWNIVPWYLGTETHIRAAGSADIRESLPYTLELLRLLPRLRVIVLVGKKAQSAAAPLRARTPLPFIETPHMSATNLNPRPEMRAVILTRFRHVADLLQPL